MQKTVTYCDICGHPDATSFSFVVDSQLDGAGDRDTINADVDLCFPCTAKQLENFIEDLPWGSRENLAKRILKEKKFYLGK